MQYFTKIAGRSISEAEAYRRASPAQRATWWPQGAPVKAEGAGAGVDLVDRVGLERAMAAGMGALREGFGGVLPDGQAPCGTRCVPCQVGRPQECRRPQSKAMATLRREQAAADRIDQAEADALELQRFIFAEQQRRRLAL